MSEETLFRIGGAYRQRNGLLVKLVEEPNWDSGSCRAVIAEAAYLHDMYYQVGTGDGVRWLDTGMYSPQEESGSDLLPGELHNVNGEWLPIEQTRPQHEPASCEEAPKTFVKRVRRPDAERKRAPLAYFTEAKRFDAFPGFVVTSDCAYESQPNTSFAGLTLDGCGAFVLPKQAF